jgi:hypothetical protein
VEGVQLTGIVVDSDSEDAMHRGFPVMDKQPVHYTATGSTQANREYAHNRIWFLYSLQIFWGFPQLHPGNTSASIPTAGYLTSEPLKGISREQRVLV